MSDSAAPALTPAELVARDPSTLDATQHRLVTSWLTTQNEIRLLTHRLAKAHERLRDLRLEIQALGSVTA